MRELASLIASIMAFSILKKILTQYKENIKLEGNSKISNLFLEQFLTLPETKPASEYIEGEIVQKPMPKGKHSRLQLKLCNCINW
ncbi:Uma2 family endonuclease [Spirulina sp. 06S082]|nr:Uma2 family endonuclease [Spirulina sp. 06S082]MEA5471725.1 Uma2 family endonuclease [Spirulina sp. 06S082]